MDLSIVIVSWNVQELVRKNLESIFKNTQNISFEVFVVDNDSKDGTAEMVKNEFPRVNLIANDFNIGFAKANNQAIEKSKGRYVLLLNPDMRVLEGSLEKMIKWMDKREQVGVGGCKLINEKGEIVPHVRRWPKLSDQLAIVLKIPHVFPKVLDRYLYKDFDYGKDKKVNSIRGSFFMIRREVIEKIGGLDERYFVWFEEVDYCRQVQRAGWSVGYNSEVQCIDYVGKSFSQIPRGRTQTYFKDSMLKYFKKWHSKSEYNILKLAWPIGELMVKAGEKINFKAKAKT